MILTEQQQSHSQIVIAQEASPSERHAAAELQYFVREISGAQLPVVTDAVPLAENEIVLGRNAHLDQIGISPHWDSEAQGSDEGFIIQTHGNRLFIAGGRPENRDFAKFTSRSNRDEGLNLRGTMYGVYTFLEDYLGCRWFSSKVSRIPKKDRIELGEINETQVPVLEYREPFYTDAFDGEWAARNKMNSNSARLGPQHGGKVKYSHFVHTFNQLLPPDKYFDAHPEYYSEIDGVRTKERTQLCLTNPDVLRLAIEGVKAWIRADPEATIFSVSQNDWHGWCRCAACAEIDEREGSHSGTILHFVNQIAEAIEAEAPHVAIDTLAYQYTRKPPQSIRPRPNVIVRLCSIECCFSHPLESCEMNTSFCEDIRGWSEVSDRLYIWDYVTNFSHYIQPFPNFDALQPNIQFFVNHGVKGIFEEGNYAPGGGGEFAELRAYVLAKLLWNPNTDGEKVMNEFLDGYYGKAASPLREYIDLLHRKVRADQIHTTIRARPDSDFLSPGILSRAEALFDEAEKAADDDEVHHRVQVARLPLQYVKLATGAVEGAERTKLIEHFFRVAEKEGIMQIREGRPLSTFREQLGG